MHYSLHPYCGAFRRANAQEKAEIVASMKATGYDREQPITLYDGKILDGGTRYDAAGEAGVDPVFTVFIGSDDEAMALVIRRNKARKHMTTGQLDLALARLVQAHQGRPEKIYGTIPFPQKKTAEIVAKEGGRSRVGVLKARELLKHAAPNIIAMVENGEMAAATAMDGIRHKSKEEQAKMTAADVRKANLARDKRQHKPSTPSKPKPVYNTKLSDLDIGTERIEGQPVMLCPANVQRLREAEIRLCSGAAGRVESMASAIDPQQLAKDITLMLSYRPVPGKKNGEERDFAKQARKAIETIGKHADKAIERLMELREVIAASKAPA